MSVTRHGKKQFQALMSTPKAHKVMKEYGEGTLHSSSGQKVTDPSQARAIAASEAERRKKQHHS